MRIDAFDSCCSPLVGVVAVSLLVSCESVRSDSDPFDSAVRAMEHEIEGRIGLYAIDTATDRTLGHRADERFAMASTFKVLLAAAVLADVDAGRLSLGDEFSADGVEIQPHSPVVGKLQDGQRIDLEALLRASVTISDNSATNMLLELVGGPVD